jgi:hypothetical protein
MEKVMIYATPSETAEALLLFMSEYQKPIMEKREIDLSEKMTREKAAKFLGVSYTTMHNWVKEGILKEHGNARKKYFLRSELIESMQNNS